MVVRKELRVKRLLTSELVRVAEELARTIEDEVLRALGNRAVDEVVLRVEISDSWPYTVEVETEIVGIARAEMLKKVLNDAIDRAMEKVREMMRERGLEAIP